MPIQNVKCAQCHAMVQDSEAVEVLVLLPAGGLSGFPWIDTIRIHLCGFCVIDPEKPIPFIVTEKGKALSMRQPAKEESNA